MRSTRLPAILSPPSTVLILLRSRTRALRAHTSPYLIPDVCLLTASKKHPVPLPAPAPLHYAAHITLLARRSCAMAMGEVGVRMLPHEESFTAPHSASPSSLSIAISPTACKYSPPSTLVRIALPARCSCAGRGARVADALAWIRARFPGTWAAERARGMRTEDLSPPSARRRRRRAVYTTEGARAGVDAERDLGCTTWPGALWTTVAEARCVGVRTGGPTGRYIDESAGGSPHPACAGEGGGRWVRGGRVRGGRGRRTCQMTWQTPPDQLYSTARRRRRLRGLSMRRSSWAEPLAPRTVGVTGQLQASLRPSEATSRTWDECADAAFRSMLPRCTRYYREAANRLGRVVVRPDGSLRATLRRPVFLPVRIVREPKMPRVGAARGRVDDSANAGRTRPPLSTSLHAEPSSGPGDDGAAFDARRHPRALRRGPGTRTRT
ncbi:hypothetical protein DFH09DRAFT_1100157 [Mycena vulgaris]|nr:hypothetical protein DFH09DRAFT_1100157 [Mycena vulgaris]